MAFFDYPDGDVGTAVAEAGDIFLPDASDDDWSLLLQHCRHRRFDPGQEVISAGGAPSSLYLVVEGELEVLVRAPGRAARYRRLTTVGPGSVLGEMSFFDRAERSALVRAMTPVEVAELGRPEFDALADESPLLGRQILFDLGRILAQRLRRAQRVV